MPANVRCTVNSCVYWDEGNRCGADEILVTGASAKERDAEMEVASLEPTPTRTSAQTECKTFKPKQR